jgi:hypothetical protein
MTPLDLVELPQLMEPHRGEAGYHGGNEAAAPFVTGAIALGLIQDELFGMQSGGNNVYSLHCFSNGGRDASQLVINIDDANGDRT